MRKIYILSNFIVCGVSIRSNKYLLGEMRVQSYVTKFYIALPPSLGTYNLYFFSERM